MKIIAKLQELERAARTQGFPVTPQRRLVLEVLAGRSDHPTADHIYDAVLEKAPTVSRTTVYRILDKLVSLQIIRKISGIEARSRFDADTTDHVHLQCVSCGAISDYRGDYQSPLPGTLPGALGGFMVMNVAVSFTGICASCRAQPPRAGAESSQDPLQ